MTTSLARNATEKQRAVQGKKHIRCDAGHSEQGVPPSHLCDAGHTLREGTT